jgi:hypothetical protein
MEKREGVKKLLNMSNKEFLSLRKKIKEFKELDELDEEEQKDFVSNNQEKFKEFQELNELFEDLYVLFNYSVGGIEELFDEQYYKL